jgi:hypothetical protein
MLRSIKQLYGEKLTATDGDIGHVRDFYFEDQHWAVRYLVADTGSWLEGRLVLISPHAFGTFHQNGDHLLVRLTCDQIEHSPAIDSHKPVSRQYEEEYYRYYGWPSYWNGGAMLGLGALPVAPPPHLLPTEEADRRAPSVDGDDPHLQSTTALDGYHIHTCEGEIGHATDFLFDDENWAIRHLIVATGHWFSSKEIAISPAQIDRISYDDSTVFVKVTKEFIQNAPECHALPLVGAGREKPLLV